MRHLTTLLELTTAEVEEILARAQALKAEFLQGVRRPVLQGRVLVQLYEKPSLRTRLSFEAAMLQMGGSAIFLPAKDAGLDGREPPEDVARVMGGYADVITLRTFSQELIHTFREYSGKPVVNGLSDDFHPCQALTDAFTARELLGDIRGVTLAYVGDGNNVARSLALVCGHLGLRFTIAAPPGFQLDQPFLQKYRQKFPGGLLEEFTDPAAAVKNAQIVYTDVWASMGQESEKELRAKAFQGYQVNSELMRKAHPQAIFMHCLPARRGLEVSDELLESPWSVIFPQAENRMHLAKGLFSWLLESKA